MNNWCICWFFTHILVCWIFTDKQTKQRIITPVGTAVHSNNGVEINHFSIFLHSMHVFCSAYSTLNIEGFAKFCNSLHVHYSLFFQFSPSNNKYDIGHVNHNLYSLHYTENSFAMYIAKKLNSTFTSIWGAQ
jgi:hypothetical protein